MNFLRYARKAEVVREPPASMLSSTPEKQWARIPSPYPPNTRLPLAEAFDAGAETIGVYAKHHTKDASGVVRPTKDTHRLLRFEHRSKIAWVRHDGSGRLKISPNSGNPTLPGSSQER